jgi:hypothetical protein
MIKDRKKLIVINFFITRDKYSSKIVLIAEGVD